MGLYRSYLVGSKSGEVSSDSVKQLTKPDVTPPLLRHGKEVKLTKLKTKRTPIA